MISSWILNYFSFSVLYGTINPTMGSLEYYYILLVMLLAIVQVDVGVNYVNKKIRERMIHIARKLKAKLSKIRFRKSIDTKSEIKRRKTLHRGFAFSQEPGSAPQVVDTVKRGSVTDSRITMMPHKHYSVLVPNNNMVSLKTFYASPKNINIDSKSVGKPIDAISEEQLSINS